MSAQNQIFSLIRLIDDESPLIQQEVAKKLYSYGPNLHKEIEQSGLVLSAPQKAIVQKVVEDFKSTRLKAAWLSWQNLPNNYARLESALFLLAEYLSAPEETVSLKIALDKVAEECRAQIPTLNEVSLAKFLFQQKKIKGNERDYYNPQNSNLNYVLQKKRGIPITLTCLYMLIGRRLGLKIEGCNFPGHFLARIDYYGKKVFIDCFNEGLLLTESDILRIRKEEGENLKKILNEKIDSTAIIMRILANLIRAFSMIEDKPKSVMMITMFKELEESRIINDYVDFSTNTFAPIKPRFACGEIVKHTRYGYQGIIVEVDHECLATDSWYYANQTQPERNQAWYHVLINDSEQISYVAESSLQVEPAPAELKHPLLSHFFNYVDGKYVRNGTPWPDMNY